MKNRDIIYVSMYTENTPYEDVIKKHFIPSAKKFGLHTKVYAVQKRGSWLKNIAHKPEVILRSLREYKNFDIVWVDADASFEHKPDLFYELPEFCDVAIHRLDHNAWYGKKDGYMEVFNGTIFLRNTILVESFVMLWIEESKDIRIGEHKHFEKLINMKNDLNICTLPIEYAYIESLPNGSTPLVKVEKPVIVHHQASRDYKKTVNVL